MERNQRTEHCLTFRGCDIGLGKSKNVEIMNDEGGTCVEISLVSVVRGEFVMVMVLET